MLEGAGGTATIEKLELARAGAGRGARAPRSERRLPLRLQRGRRHHEHRWPVVLGHEGAGVVEAVGRGRDARRSPATTSTLSWTPSCGECGECLRDLPQLCSTIWPIMGAGGLMDATSRLSRERRDRLPLLLPVDVRRGVRRPRARRACRSPKEVPFDVAGPRRLRGDDRGGRGLEYRRRAAGRPSRRDRLRRCRPLRADGGGRGRRGAGDRRRRDAGASWTWRGSSARAAGVVWAGRAEETAEAVREASGGGVDYAIEATGRGEAMLAAVLSTRTRGAAVLIGIPRAETVVPLPALTIPRMERRVLGSIYGSARAERDFPKILERYLAGRLPLDRLVSHRLPLEAVDRRVRADELGRGAARRSRPGSTRNRWRSSMNLDELDGRIGEGWGGLSPNGCHVNVVLARRGSADGGGGDLDVRPPVARSLAGALLRRAASQPEYQPIWPPTLMMNKATATTPSSRDDDVGCRPARHRPGAFSTRSPTA